MIGRGAALLEHLNVAAALLGHADQHEEEVVAGHVAGHQDSADPKAANRCSRTGDKAGMIARESFPQKVAGTKRSMPPAPACAP
jgi:hypothetical protein